MVFLDDFFAALPALFFGPDFLEAFFAFLAFATLVPAADFFAFFGTFLTASMGANFAAAFLTRLTTVSAAECASRVAPLTTKSPTISPRSCFGWSVLLVRLLLGIHWNPPQ